MKSILFFVFIFLFSCNFYMDSKFQTISGTDTGLIVITSSVSWREIFVTGKSSITFSMKKGEIYYVTYYSELNGRKSRYPLGAILDFERDVITLSPHIGLLTEECNKFNLAGKKINFNNVHDLEDLLLKCEDPWIYNREDIRLCLNDEIGVSSVSELKIVLIPELDLYYTWIPENKLFSRWYPSIQSFCDISGNRCFRVEIYNDGSFYGFEEINIEPVSSR